MAAHELGLADGIEIVPVAMTPGRERSRARRGEPPRQDPRPRPGRRDRPIRFPRHLRVPRHPTRRCAAVPRGGAGTLDRAPPPGARGRAPRRRDPLPLRDLPASRGAPVGGLDRGTAGEVPPRPRRPRRRGGELRRHGRHRHHFGRVRGGLPRLPVARRRMARGPAAPCRLARRVRGPSVDAGDASERLSGRINPRDPAGRLR